MLETTKTVRRPDQPRLRTVNICSLTVDLAFTKIYIATHTQTFSTCIYIISKQRDAEGKTIVGRDEQREEGEKGGQGMEAEDSQVSRSEKKLSSKAYPCVQQRQIRKNPDKAFES